MSPSLSDSIGVMECLTQWHRDDGIPSDFLLHRISFTSALHVSVLCGSSPNSVGYLAGVVAARERCKEVGASEECSTAFLSQAMNILGRKKGSRASKAQQPSEPPGFIPFDFTNPEAFSDANLAKVGPGESLVLFVVLSTDQLDFQNPLV